MATEIVKTIGATGDYTTLQAWEDAITADIVSADEQHTGKCLDEVFTANLIISGHTTDATRFIKLTTDTGASFTDDDTQRLEYDTTLGAAIEALVTLDDNYSVIENLQSFQSSTTLNNIVGAGTNCTVRHNIVKFRTSGIRSTADNWDVHTNLVQSDSDSTTTGIAGILVSAASSRIVANTVPRPNNRTDGSNGIHVNYGRPDGVSNACFGFASGRDFWKQGGAAWSTNSDYNASNDASAPGANSLISESYTDTAPFVASDDTATLNFKLSAGSNLEGAGTPHALTNDVDIYYNPRSATAPDIGCYEIQAAASQTITVPLLASTRAISSPTIAQQSEQALTIPLITSTRVIPGPTIEVAGAQNIVAPLIASSRTIPVATIAGQAALIIDAPLIASSRTIPSPLIAIAGVQTIVAPLLPATRVIPAPILEAENASVIAPPLLAATRIIPNPTLAIVIPGIFPPLVVRPRTIPRPIVALERGQALASIANISKLPVRVPDEIRELNTELHDYLQKQANILRLESEEIRTGQALLPLNFLTKLTPLRLYQLGAIAQFQHQVLGFITAMYVQFSDMVVDGGPCGFLSGADTTQLKVTNSFSKSAASLVAGILPNLAVPSDGQFGWIVIQGVNLFPINIRAGDVGIESAELYWSGTNELSVDSIGLVVGQQLSAVAVDDSFAIGSIKFAISSSTGQAGRAVINTRIDELESTVDDNASSIATLAQTVATEDDALALSVNAVLATAGINTAGITESNRARASADDALAVRIETVEASISPAIGAAVQVETLARTNEDEALAAQVVSLDTKYGRITGELNNTQANLITTIAAQSNQSNALVEQTTELNASLSRRAEGAKENLLDDPAAGAESSSVGTLIKQVDILIADAGIEIGVPVSLSGFQLSDDIERMGLRISFLGAADALISDSGILAQTESPIYAYGVVEGIIIPVGTLKIRCEAVRVTAAATSISAKQFMLVAGESASRYPYTTANARATTVLSTRVTANESGITSNASAITILEATVSGHTTDIAARATITQVNTADATLQTDIDTRATASSVTLLQAQVNGIDSDVAAVEISAAANASSITGLEAKFSVKVIAGNVVTGIELLSGAGGTSEIKFQADKIQFVNSSGVGQVGFEVIGGVTFIKAAMIQSLTVAKLSDGDMDAELTLAGAAKIVFRAGSYIKVQGIGFGSSSQFVEWYGLDMAYNLMTEANAITYLKTNGSAYFGGALHSGTLFNSITGTELAVPSDTTLGPFGSNGGASIIITQAYTMTVTGSRTGDQTPQTGTMTATIKLYQKVGAASETLVATNNITGGVTFINYDSELNKTSFRFDMSLSASFTDNATTTDDRTYRIEVSARTLFAVGGSGPADVLTQKKTLTSSEA